MEKQIRPGAYINVTGNTTLSVGASTRGTLVLPLVLDYGAEGEFLSVSNNSQCLTKLGYPLLDEKMILVREALKGASVVKVYRVNGGTKAAETDSGVTVTAKYSGTRGNDLGVVIKEVGDKFDVAVSLDGAEVESFRVKEASEIKSDYVVVTGTLAEATLVLSGGTTLATANYDAFLEACKIESFETIAYTGDESAVITKLVNFVKEQRDHEFKKITAVYGATTNTADDEGIIVVSNGVKLADGTVLDKNKVCAWVGGVTAGAQITESNTFRGYEGAIDVDVRYTNTQIEGFIEKGFFLFSVRGTKVVAEYDTNSLVTFTNTKPESFHKNKIIRVLDAIANDVKSMYEAHFIGKVQNNEGGRALLKGYLAEYLKTLQDDGAIVDFDASDIVIKEGTTKESVVITVGVTPTDTVDKIYMDVEVN